MICHLHKWTIKNTYTFIIIKHQIIYIYNTCTSSPWLPSEMGYFRQRMISPWIHRLPTVGVAPWRRSLSVDHWDPRSPVIWQLPNSRPRARAVEEPVPLGGWAKTGLGSVVFITMVIVSPLNGVMGPFPNGRFMTSYKSGLLSTY